MAEMVMVKSLLPERDDGGFPVALYEQDAAHPDGEAFVAGPDPVEVARTGLVNRRISEDALEIVEGDADDEPKARRSSRRAAPDDSGEAPKE